MPKAVQVFTPNDVPTFSYVERASLSFASKSSNIMPTVE